MSVCLCAAPVWPSSPVPRPHPYPALVSSPIPRLLLASLPLFLWRASAFACAASAASSARHCACRKGPRRLREESEGVVRST